jgi:glycosyltransferase involved in cell wall biosynthesis
MKITFLLPYASIAGGIRVAAIYAQKFTEMGHQVTVISQGKSEPSPQTRWRRNLRKLVNPRKRRSRKKPPTQQLDFLGDRHIQITRPFPLNPEDIPDADVIIATWWETAFAISELPPEKGRKFYLIQHHEVHPHLPHHLSHGSYYLPMKKVAISQWLVDIMKKDYGDQDVALIHNSVDTEQFNAPEREKRSVPTVGLLYAKNPFKGVDISLKAIERARKRVPDLKVVAFSAKPEDPRLPLPDDSNFYLSPAQNKIRDIYASCDVWLCGSHSEGFHLPPSEAMACRCPVVSTRIGGAVEIIREGLNGHVVDVGDHIALGDRLADVLQTSPEKWKAMSDSAYAQAHSYTWDEAARRFLAVLEADGAAEATPFRTAAN